MKLKISRGNPLRGVVNLPGDKSISHRAVVISAFANGESRIENFLVAGVTEVLLGAVAELGIDWDLHGKVLTIKSKGVAQLKTPKMKLDCGNSATTMRLLIGLLAASGISAELDGSHGLRRRPMGRVVEPLQAMGVPISASNGGTAPIHLKTRPQGQKLEGIKHSLPVASAQVKTAVLLAALVANSPTVVEEPGLSRDHTERLLASLGVEIAVGGKINSSVQLSPLDLGKLPPLSISVPGDFSSASFLIVAALMVPGSLITIKNVGLNPTRTGLLEILIKMGANIQVSELDEDDFEPRGDLTVRSSSLHGVNVDAPVVVRMIDEFPVFAVAASLAKGQTVVQHAAELRYKESDRIAAICDQLAARGVDIRESEDGFVVNGGSNLLGGTAKANGDHRMAMAMAVAGLVSSDPLVVEGAEIIHESFPEFEKTLRGLGANILGEE